jgi:hypothetical protein
MRIEWSGWIGELTLKKKIGMQFGTSKRCLPNKRSKDDIERTFAGEIQGSSFPFHFQSYHWSELLKAERIIGVGCEIQKGASENMLMERITHRDASSKTVCDEIEKVTEFALLSRLWLASFLCFDRTRRLGSGRGNWTALVGRRRDDRWNLCDRDWADLVCEWGAK